MIPWKRLWRWIRNKLCPKKKTEETKESESKEGHGKDIAIMLVSVIVAGLVSFFYIDCHNTCSEYTDHTMIRTAVFLGGTCLGIGISLLSIRRSQRMDKQ
ncbi:MAG: hypothetical protein OXB93_01525, partial [Cytophagales bacterium]|nr:hypothetical protein [Cytophagales bacterium]